MYWDRRVSYRNYPHTVPLSVVFHVKHATAGALDAICRRRRHSSSLVVGRSHHPGRAVPARHCPAFGSAGEGNAGPAMRVYPPPELADRAVSMHFPLRFRPQAPRSDHSSRPPTLATRDGQSRDPALDRPPLHPPHGHTATGARPTDSHIPSGSRTTNSPLVTPAELAFRTGVTHVRIPPEWPCPSACVPPYAPQSATAAGPDPRAHGRSC